MKDVGKYLVGGVVGVILGMFLAPRRARVGRSQWAPQVPLQQSLSEGVPRASEAELRRRIEETRRRIQEELERPFQVEETDVAVAEGPKQPAPDYDEIRRRIEETRARLKAKAFDALMSGETILMGRDSTQVRASAPDIHGVDEEVEQSIEQSLKETDG